MPSWCCARPWRHTQAERTRNKPHTQPLPPHMNFPLFIAKRIFTNQGDERKVSRPAIMIATAGVAIGLAVMLVSVSVVLGFKHTIRDKVIGFGSHIQVANFLTQQTSSTYPIVIDQKTLKTIKSIPGVAHVQVTAIKQGVGKTDTDFLGLVFKGVGPDFDTTFIHQNIVEGSIPKFSDKQSTGKLLVSKMQADKLGLKCGDRIFAYFIDDNGVRARRFSIEGIYRTNLSQYDEVICFADIYTVRKLNAWEDDEATYAEITVSDFEQLQEVEDRMIADINRTTDRNGNTFSAMSVKELSPQIFTWLDLLDLNVWIILALMTAVAGVTMISGLLIIILERTTMIGVLKALGARNKTIRRTFLWFAAFIIGRGMVIGDAIGIGLLLLQRTTGIVKLDPQTYYVSEVPVEFTWLLFAIINIATMAVCIAVLVGPSFLISHIHPAKSMRYE